MRYYLEQEVNGEKSEVGGQRKSTKKEIDQWCEDNIAACGLDWRAGYQITFKNSKHIYTWRWIKDNTEVKYGN